MFAGITVRIILLIALGWLIQQKGKPLFTLFGKGFDLASLAMLAGGLFLLYKTVKEIHHKLEGEEDELQGVKPKTSSFANAIDRADYPGRYDILIR